MGQWFELEIVADMSEADGGSWSLRVTSPQGDLRVWRDHVFGAIFLSSTQSATR